MGGSLVKVRDCSLFVEVVGTGEPLALMHGGPSADHWSLLPYRRLADRFTLVFYDHRCNGRSRGAELSTMTWENLTADADALREALGFERWSVLGHSFGGHVALEYALRYPRSLSKLILVDTGGDARWSRENALTVLAGRGYGPETVELVRRWFTGDFEPREFLSILFRIGGIYSYDPSVWPVIRELVRGEWRSKFRAEALIYAGRRLMPGWTVMDRLGGIQAPTLVMAGSYDPLFPPEHQAELAAGIPGARLRLIERAGHNPHSEQPAEVMREVRDFMSQPAIVRSPTRASR